MSDLLRQRRRFALLLATGAHRLMLWAKPRKHLEPSPGPDGEERNDQFFEQGTPVRADQFPVFRIAGVRQARARLVGRYGDVHSDEADVVVALGGDGLMLQTLHTFMGRNVPIYGMNCGSVGFLMNEFRETGLRKRLAQAKVRSFIPCA